MHVTSPLTKLLTHKTLYIELQLAELEIKSVSLRKGQPQYALHLLSYPTHQAVFGWAFV